MGLYEPDLGPQRRPPQFRALLPFGDMGHAHGNSDTARDLPPTLQRRQDRGCDGVDCDDGYGVGPVTYSTADAAGGSVMLGGCSPAICAKPTAMAGRVTRDCEGWTNTEEGCSVSCDSGYQRRYL